MVFGDGLSAAYGGAPWAATAVEKDVTEWPWRCCKQVLPQHADHAGVLGHGAYVAWLEEARVEALAAAGLAYAELSATGLELMVVELQLRYRRPLRHGESVELRSRISGAKGLRLPFHTRFITPAGELAAEALVTLALVDRERGKPLRRPPERLARALEILAKGC
jgi:acyl-CoA thioester hydrolase